MSEAGRAGMTERAAGRLEVAGLFMRWVGVGLEFGLQPVCVGVRALARLRWSWSSGFSPSGGGVGFRALARLGFEKIENVKIRD